MSKQKGKTTVALMRHIRKNHKIHINGSKDKKDLLNMGYYHGYKRYRFIKVEVKLNLLLSSLRLKPYMNLIRN